MPSRPKNTGSTVKGVARSSPLMIKVKDALRLKTLGPGCSPEKYRGQSPFDRVLADGTQFPDPAFQPPNENMAMFSTTAKVIQRGKAIDWFISNQTQEKLKMLSLDFDEYDHPARVTDRRSYHGTGGDTADDEDIAEMINFGLRTALKVELPLSLTGLTLTQDDFEEYKDQNKSQSENSCQEKVLFRCAMALILLEQSPLADCLCTKFAQTFTPLDMEYEGAKRRSTYEGATSKSLKQSTKTTKPPENEGIWFSHRINHLIGGDCMAFPDEGRAVFGCYKRRCTVGA